MRAFNNVYQCIPQHNLTQIGTAWYLRLDTRCLIFLVLFIWIFWPWFSRHWYRKIPGWTDNSLDPSNGFEEGNRVASSSTKKWGSLNPDLVDFSFGLQYKSKCTVHWRLNIGINQRSKIRYWIWAVLLQPYCTLTSYALIRVTSEIQRIPQHSLRSKASTSTE